MSVPPLGADRTAAYRRIEQMDAALGEARGQIADEGGRHRAAQDHRAARRQGFQRAILAEQHVLDLGVVDHHDEQKPSVLGRCGGVCGGFATGLDQGFERRLAAIATGHRKTRLEQVCRHAGAHGAEPDESDLLVSLHGRILYAAAQPCSMNATVAFR